MQAHSDDLKRFLDGQLDVNRTRQDAGFCSDGFAVPSSSFRNTKIRSRQPVNTSGSLEVRTNDLISSGEGNGDF